MRPVPQSLIPPRRRHDILLVSVHHPLTTQQKHPLCKLVSSNMATQLLSHLHLPKFFNHYHRLHQDRSVNRPPKGSVVVTAAGNAAKGGRGHGEEQPQRFVVPIDYLGHPLLQKLLQASEEEYGFDQAGPIALPCTADEFIRVQETIRREQKAVRR